MPCCDFYDIGDFLISESTIHMFRVSLPSGTLQVPKLSSTYNCIIQGLMELLEEK